MEWRRGKLLPRLGFLVTNMPADPEWAAHLHNGRGTAERWINKGWHALYWTRLSCHRFAANQVRPALFILAHNLGNFLRRPRLAKAVEHRPLPSFQIKLIKIEAELVRHVRRPAVQLAKVSVPRALFRECWTASAGYVRQVAGGIGLSKAAGRRFLRGVPPPRACGV